MVSLRRKISLVVLSLIVLIVTALSLHYLFRTPTKSIPDLDGISNTNSLPECETTGCDSSQTTDDSNSNTPNMSDAANSSRRKSKSTNTQVSDITLPEGRYESQVFSSTIETKDVFYRSAVNNEEGGMTQLYMNIYQPADDTYVSRRPLLIFLHQGGWCMGNRTDEDASAIYYAKLGYVTATIDYRKRPGIACGVDPGTVQIDINVYFDMMTDSTNDLLAAYAFLKSQSSEYRIDTTKAADLGWSAGGMTVLRSLMPDIDVNSRPKVSVAMGATIPSPMEDYFGYAINMSPLLLVNPIFDEQWPPEFYTPDIDCARHNSRGGDCQSVLVDSSHANLSFNRYSNHIVPFLKTKLSL